MSRETIHPCPMVGTCGGCQTLPSETYSSHLQRKLKKIDGLGRFGSPDSLWEPRQLLHYRPKVEWRLRWTDDGMNAGYFQKESRAFLAIENCPIAQPLINQLLNELPSFSESPGTAHKARLVLQVVESGQQIAAKLVCPAEDRDAWQRFCQWMVSRPFVTWCGMEGVEEKPYLVDRGGCWTTASLFRQGNEEANQFLKSKIHEWLDGQRVKTLFELFCGNGNLTRDWVGRVHGFDSHSQAIDLANEDEIPEHYYVQHNCYKGLPKLEECDALLVDPPRAGLRNLAREIAESSVETVIYVSCEPESFLADWQEFEMRDAQVVEWVAVDMLPWTERWEVLFLIKNN